MLAMVRRLSAVSPQQPNAAWRSLLRVGASVSVSAALLRRTFCCAPLRAATDLCVQCTVKVAQIRERRKARQIHKLYITLQAACYV
jgi:hypothetical protein